MSNIWPSMHCWLVPGSKWLSLSETGCWIDRPVVWTSKGLLMLSIPFLILQVIHCDFLCMVRVPRYMPYIWMHVLYMVCTNGIVTSIMIILSKGVPLQICNIPMVCVKDNLGEELYSGENSCITVSQKPLCFRFGDACKMLVEVRPKCLQHLYCNQI